MGCAFSNQENLHASLKRIKGDRILHVATLNYCGILKSPFEFYSGQYHEELKRLSQIFQRLRGKYVKVPTDRPFQWQFGKLDKKVKEKRYCPLYNPKVGVVDGKLITRAEFVKIWNETIKKVETEDKIQIQTAERQEALSFDLLSYHTLLHYLYGVESIDEAQGKDPSLYVSTLGQFFDQTFLDEDKKILKFKKGLEHTLSDIVFIQEGNDTLIKSLENNGNYHIEASPDKDTLICVKKDKFKEIKPMKAVTLFDQEELNLLNWNNHSTVILADTYILISGHLSSSKSLNEENVKTLKKGFEMLREKHPNYDVICGVDVNSFLGEFNPNINVYPKEKSRCTSLKMRTSMQTQSSKAEIESRQSKDAILTTLPIIDGQISTINLITPSDTTFLPQDGHPFDHFLVFTKLCIEKDTNTSQI